MTKHVDLALDRHLRGMLTWTAVYITCEVYFRHLSQPNLDHLVTPFPCKALTLPRSESDGVHQLECSSMYSVLLGLLWNMEASSSPCV